MIFVSLAGCSALREMEVKWEVQEYLTTGQQLLDQGDYAGALENYQKVLALRDNIPPGDEALFNAALIYAHQGRPKRSYQKSLALCRRLVKVFPESPWAGQAKILIDILQENDRLSEKTEELDRTAKQVEQENERLRKEIEELTNTIKKSEQVDIEIDQKKKELSR